MKFKDLKIEDKNYILSKVKTKIIASKYNVTPKTVSIWRNKILNAGVIATTKDPLDDLEIISPDKIKIKKLIDENKNLKKVIEDARSKVISSEDIRNLVQDVKSEGFKTDEIPIWLNKVKKTKNVIVPVACLSDIHLGEVVDEGDIGFGDNYNTEIAHKFADKVIKDFVEICEVNMSNYSYDGVILILGGDGITGNLHDLAETNDNTPIQQVVELTNLYSRVIRTLKKKFGKVAVMGVTGNHGRLDGSQYTKLKQRTHNSLENLIYIFLEKEFSSWDSVNIITSQNDEILFSVNGRKFNLQHGDTIKGGSGIGGIHVPIMRSRAKKLSTAVANNKAFDTLILGHFHQHYVSDELIIMNSLKPYDEYSKAMNFGYTRPGMTSFFINNHGDIIFATDIKIRKENSKPHKGKSLELF